MAQTRETISMGNSNVSFQVEHDETEDEIALQFSAGVVAPVLHQPDLFPFLRTTDGNLPHGLAHQRDGSLLRGGPDSPVGHAGRSREQIHRNSHRIEINDLFSG